jgi:hypothetical protein
MLSEYLICNLCDEWVYLLIIIFHFLGEVRDGINVVKGLSENNWKQIRKLRSSHK